MGQRVQPGREILRHLNKVDYREQMLAARVLALVVPKPVGVDPLLVVLAWVAAVRLELRATVLAVERELRSVVAVTRGAWGRVADALRGAAIRLRAARVSASLVREAGLVSSATAVGVSRTWPSAREQEHKGRHTPRADALLETQRAT